MAPDTLLWNMARRRKQYQVAARINRAENLSAILAEVEKYEVVLLENVDALVHQAVTKCWFEYNIRLYILPRISDILIRRAGERGRDRMYVYYGIFGAVESENHPDDTQGFVDKGTDRGR